jgi:hypothetical protein
MAQLTTQTKQDISDFLQANIEDFRKDAIEYGDLELTIACNDSGDQWNYQTGDNSFTGNCYSLPHWAVSTITEDTTTGDIVFEIIDQLEELIYDIEED